MKIHLARFLSLAVFLSSLHLVAAAPRVLVYQKNGKGFVHDNLAASAAALRELGAQNGFTVDVSSDPSVFTVATLKQYRALIFATRTPFVDFPERHRSTFKHLMRPQFFS